MNLEIKHVGMIDTVDEMKKDRLWIGVDASSKTSTVFLTLSKKNMAVI